MFFIMGFGQKSRKLGYAMTDICSICGKYGRYEVDMVYDYFSFFFIPIIKWNKKYYVTMSCCQSVYKLSPEKGKLIARGNQVEIEAGELELIRQEHYYHYTESREERCCPSCGYNAEGEFAFCLKCGIRL